MTGWESCYIHPQWEMILSVYVDDFKMAGPSANLAAGWSLIRSKIKMDDPTNMEHFLGCTHRSGHAKLDSGVVVRTMTYDMQCFLEACLDLYTSLTGKPPKFRPVPTPFLEEGPHEAGVAVADGPWTECPYCAGRFPDATFARMSS